MPRKTQLTPLTAAQLDRMRQLDAEGIPMTEIATTLGISYQRVYHSLRSRHEIGKPPLRIDLVLRHPIGRRFTAEAELMGIPTRTLVRKILEHVAEDNLFAAVIDK